MGQYEKHSIRLLLLDDHVLFRASLGRYLSMEGGFEVSAGCGSSAEAIEVLKKSTVEVVLLELHLGAEDGNEFISAARKEGYSGRFLFVAGAADAKSAALAFKLGASGIFLKSEPPERLLQAIRLVADGEIWVDPRVLEMLADESIDHYRMIDPDGAVLEDRERLVLLGILGGLTNKKIGVKLGLSESSVKNVVQRLFGKAGVKTRSQLVRVALEGSLGVTRDMIKSRDQAANPLLLTQLRD